MGFSVNSRGMVLVGVNSRGITGSFNKSILNDCFSLKLYINLLSGRVVI